MSVDKATRPWTSGEWTLHKRTPTTVVAGEQGVCSTGSYTDSSRDITELQAEQEANARLISASPELYRALELLANAEDNWDTEIARELARKALNKANPDTNKPACEDCGHVYGRDDLRYCDTCHPPIR